MQEVQGFLQGDWNYANLKGDTGPLVYPGGFVWLYSALYFITDLGQNIRVRPPQLAQFIFLGLYVVNQYIVLRTYSHLGFKWSSLLFLCTSYRLHSISLLRLFNDPVAMLFLNLALYRAVHNRWGECVILYSLALSIKMNVLLYLPGLLLCLFVAKGSRYILRSLASIVSIQLIVALPFLWEAPDAYLSKAFEFTRVFEQKWSVNWQFLSRELFIDSRFHLCLLVLHLVLLMVYLYRQTGHNPVNFLAAVLEDLWRPERSNVLPGECKV
jgi:alpha-1,3-mannosyltransferase